MAVGSENQRMRHTLPDGVFPAKVAAGVFRVVRGAVARALPFTVCSELAR